MKFIGALICIVGWAIFAKYTPTVDYFIGAICVITGDLLYDYSKNKELRNTLKEIDKIEKV